MSKESSPGAGSPGEGKGAAAKEVALAASQVMVREVSPNTGFRAPERLPRIEFAPQHRDHLIQHVSLAAKVTQLGINLQPENRNRLTAFEKAQASVLEEESKLTFEEREARNTSIDEWLKELSILEPEKARLLRETLDIALLSAKLKQQEGIPQEVIALENFLRLEEKLKQQGIVPSVLKEKMDAAVMQVKDRKQQSQRKQPITPQHEIIVIDTAADEERKQQLRNAVDRFARNNRREETPYDQVASLGSVFQWTRLAPSSIARKHNTGGSAERIMAILNRETSMSIGAIKNHIDAVVDGHHALTTGEGRLPTRRDLALEGVEIPDEQTNTPVNHQDIKDTIVIHAGLTGSRRLPQMQD
jgi:hypothetical protein